MVLTNLCSLFILFDGLSRLAEASRALSSAPKDYLNLQRRYRHSLAESSRLASRPAPGTRDPLRPLPGKRRHCGQPSVSTQLSRERLT